MIEPEQMYFSELHSGGHVFHFAWTPGGEWRALLQALKWAHDPGLCFSLADVAHFANALGDHLQCQSSPTDTGKRGVRTVTRGRGDDLSAN